MSVDEESWSFGLAKRQIAEMLDEVNQNAPYGLEHRREVTVEFKMTERQMEQLAPILTGASLEELRRLSDPKNYSQYRL